jgi:hypothetical protein
VDIEYWLNSKCVVLGIRKKQSAFEYQNFAYGNPKYRTFEFGIGWEKGEEEIRTDK